MHARVPVLSATQSRSVATTPTASRQSVILAIVIPEVPRVVRLVRGVVLTLRGAFRGAQLASCRTNVTRVPFDVLDSRYVTSSPACHPLQDVPA